MKWTTETGETRYLAVHALPAWGGGSQCDSADLIAALQANAAACGEVMAAMGWVTDRALAVTGERADQAERSLATVTAERDEARARLRDVGEYCRELQAHALPTDCVRCGGVGAEPPCCPESGPCECCGGWTAHKRLIVAEPAALRARLTAVERERDEARAERDTLGRRVEDAQAALNECGAGFTGQPEATRIRDLRARLAESTEWGSRACEVLGYVLGTLNLCDEQHWAFDPLNVEPVKDKAVAVRLLVRDLRAQLAKTERVVEAASDMLTGNCACDKYGVADTCSCAYEREERLRVALRALDSPVVAGTVSGGSGAATPEGGHAAPTGGPMPPPEPAGISCRCGAGCKPVPRYAGDDDSPVGVAATAEDGHEAPAPNRQPVEPPSDPATGTTRREPPETDRQDGSTGAVAGDQLASALLEKRADGWHYHDAEYPDEGYVGPFSLAIAAIAHAEGEGYLVDGADEHAPATRAEVEELKRRVDRLETLTGFVPKE